MKPTSLSCPLFLFPLSASLPPLSIAFSLFILSLPVSHSSTLRSHPPFPLPSRQPFFPFHPLLHPPFSPAPSLPRRRLIVPHRCVPRFLSIRAYIKRIVYDKSSSLEFNKTSIRPLQRASRCIYDARVCRLYARVHIVASSPECVSECIDRPSLEIIRHTWTTCMSSFKRTP